MSILLQPLKHIAFIMDGNGRWAKTQKKPRLFGHQQGVKQIAEIIESCLELNIQHMSFFAFSTENWNRPKLEINGLLKIIKNGLIKITPQWFCQRKIALKVIGFEHPNLKIFYPKINKLMQATALQTEYTVNIYVNYGSQQEIVAACNSAIKLKQMQTVESFNSLLLTTNLPAVDLLIRTGKEHRLSNFLLWQCAYAEIIFEQSYWPEYNKYTLEKNILEYNKRKRRYGGL